LDIENLDHRLCERTPLRSFFHFSSANYTGETGIQTKVRAQCGWTIAFIAWESNSITNQKAILYKYAEDNGFSKPVFYVDDGVSGTTFERDGFKAMMSDIEDGKVGTVITKDLSRLGRDYLKTGELI